MQFQLGALAGLVMIASSLELSPVHKIESLFRKEVADSIDEVRGKLAMERSLQIASFPKHFWLQIC